MAWGKPARAVLICCGVSLLIEMLQYVTGLGLCELDDVVSNTLGGFIGVMTAIGLAWAGKKLSGKIYRSKGE